jgi:hypothetical protein
MKKIIIYIVLMISTFGVLQSQNLPKEPVKPLFEKGKSDLSEPSKITTPEKKVTDSTKILPNNVENSGHQRRYKNCDNFVDKDGDGINDNRCNGFGAGKCNGKGRRNGKK